MYQITGRSNIITTIPIASQFPTTLLNFNDHYLAHSSLSHSTWKYFCIFGEKQVCLPQIKSSISQFGCWTHKKGMRRRRSGVWENGKEKLNGDKFDGAVFEEDYWNARSRK